MEGRNGGEEGGGWRLRWRKNDGQGNCLKLRGYFGDRGARRGMEADGERTMEGRSVRETGRCL